MSTIQEKLRKIKELQNKHIVSNKELDTKITDLQLDLEEALQIAPPFIQEIKIPVILESDNNVTDSYLTLEKGIRNRRSLYEQEQKKQKGYTFPSFRIYFVYERAKTFITSNRTRTVRTRLLDASVAIKIEAMPHLEKVIDQLLQRIESNALKEELERNNH